MTLDVRVSDCTLRDTRNAPGVFMGLTDVVEIAQHLDTLGVDEIEIGGGGLNAEEAEVARAVNGLCPKAKVSQLVFCVQSQDIEEAAGFVLEAGSPVIMISLPSSERFIELRLKRSLRATCKLVEKVVGYAARAGLEVVFSGEDAARANPDQLLDYVRAGAGAGASRFRFAESVSALEPESMAERISVLREKTQIAIDVHCHSAYGLAVANTLAAVRAGARWVSCTVGGLGERGGNTPLEALALYLWRFGGRSDLELSALKPLADRVGRATGIPPSRFASAVGDDSFQYEKGNMFRFSDAYEAYPPELVGNRRSLVIGKKADPLSLRIMLEMLKLDPNAYALDRFATHLSQLAQERRRCIGTSELQRIIEEEGNLWSSTIEA